MDINEAFDLAATELEQAVFGGLSDTEECKACVFDILPIESRDVKTLPINGTTRLKAELCCSLSSNVNIEEFVSAYNKQTIETLKIAASKRVVREVCRCIIMQGMLVQDTLNRFWREILQKDSRTQIAPSRWW